MDFVQTEWIISGKKSITEFNNDSFCLKIFYNVTTV